MQQLLRRDLRRRRSCRRTPHLPRRMQQLLRRDLRRRGRQGAWTPQQGAEPIKRRDQWSVAEALADCYELPPLQGRNDSEQRFDHGARVLSASHYG